jgi:hypothetical protein
MQINEGDAPNTFWRLSLSNLYEFQLPVAAVSALRGMVVVLRAGSEKAATSGVDLTFAWPRVGKANVNPKLH